MKLLLLKWGCKEGKSGNVRQWKGIKEAAPLPPTEEGKTVVGDSGIVEDVLGKE